MTDKDASVRMVFKNFKSVIPGRYTGTNGFYFGAIPYREKYTILAYKVVDDKVAVATRLSDDDTPDQNVARVCTFGRAAYRAKM